MPWGDGTGPLGLGPMTGRGLGYCAGFGVPGFMWGPGRGFGRGFRWRRFAFLSLIRPPVRVWEPIPVKDEKKILLEELKALEEEKRYLEEEIKALKKRIEELK